MESKSKPAFASERLAKPLKWRWEKGCLSAASSFFVGILASFVENEEQP